ncbi:MAG TPA: hypothetical protein ENI09_01490, partial [candidate division WWE3 bacterium]|nr:hypothetical protein [candidate division WWE3 bacterium]
SSLFEILERILAEDGDAVEIEVPEENFNLLMLRTLQEKAKKEKKKLVLKPTGSRSKNLIQTLTEGEEGEVVEVKAKKKARKINFGALRKLAFVPLILVGFLILLGGGAYWALYYLPRAEVILTLNPIPFVKEISVSADIAAEEIDAEKGIIPGTLHTVMENGEKTVDTTGIAIIGKEATGRITFDTTGAQSCEKGAKFKEDSGLVFITVRAFDIQSGATPEEDVVAEKIGEQYNLGPNKSFTLVNGCSTSVVGTNSAGFEGGTSEEVPIVAAADQAEVLEDFKKDLVKEGKKTIIGEGGLDEVIVEKAIKSEVTKKTFSHAVGEQTDKLTLNLTMKFTIITYSGASMQDLISQTISTLIPEGYTLFPGETSVEPLDPKLSKNKLSFQAKVSSDVVPEIDTEKIKNDLTGRNPASAQEYLSSLGEVNAYEIKIWPNLPESFQRVPRNTDRITITLKTEEL